jgi:hypothetical protein
MNADQRAAELTPEVIAHGRALLCNMQHAGSRLREAICAGGPVEITTAIEMRSKLGDFFVKHAEAFLADRASREPAGDLREMAIEAADRDAAKHKYGWDHKQYRAAEVAADAILALLPDRGREDGMRRALKRLVGAAINELVAADLPPEWGKDGAIGCALAELGCFSTKLDDAVRDAIRIDPDDDAQTGQRGRENELAAQLAERAEAAEARVKDLEAERSEIVSRLDMIHKAAFSTGPKQALGEMVAALLNEQRAALSQTGQRQEQGGGSQPSPDADRWREADDFYDAGGKG